MHTPFLQPQHPLCCWLFCTVIDNYGDIGVSWRLAQILSRELGWHVHLWLDDEQSLAPLAPPLPALPAIHQSVFLHRWRAGAEAEDLSDTPAPDVVIETFACDLPQAVLDIIRTQRALWLNWEYLSAEDWARAMHAKPSPQTNGVQKYFWLMGFSETDGGLLREKNFDSLSAITDMPSLRRQLMLPPKNLPEWLLFGYQSTAWARWLTMWLQHGEAMRLLIPAEPVLCSLREAGIIPPNALLQSGDTYILGKLELHRLPFLPQHDFDRLLALCDGLIVRGEDSFVRAQFSGKPFFWHIYPQEEQAHHEKLHAFWLLSYLHFEEPVITAHRQLSDDLNGVIELSEHERLFAWQTLCRQQQSWRNAAESWRNYLFSQNSATERLANFVADKLK